MAIPAWRDVPIRAVYRDAGAAVRRGPSEQAPATGHRRRSKRLRRGRAPYTPGLRTKPPALRVDMLVKRGQRLIRPVQATRSALRIAPVASAFARLPPPLLLCSCLIPRARRIAPRAGCLRLIVPRLLGPYLTLPLRTHPHFPRVELARCLPSIRTRPVLYQRGAAGALPWTPVKRFRKRGRGKYECKQNER